MQGGAVLRLPVCAVQLHHLLLQLFALPGGQAEILHVVRAVHLRVVLAQLGLGGVGAEEGERDKGAGKDAAHDVLPQLETQEVSEKHVRDEELRVRGTRGDDMFGFSF